MYIQYTHLIHEGRCHQVLLAPVTQKQTHENSNKAKKLLVIYIFLSPCNNANMFSHTFWSGLENVIGSTNFDFCDSTDLEDFNCTVHILISILS